MRKVKHISDFYVLGLTKDKVYNVIKYFPSSSISNNTNIDIVKIINDMGVTQLYYVPNYFIEATSEYRNSIIDEILSNEEG